MSFYSNPTGAPPLSADILVDDCGRYLVSELPVPPLSFVALAADDASLMADNLVLSATTISTSDGQELIGHALYSVQTATDERWTTSAGDPFAGQTFAEVGVFAAIFVTGEIPTSGVKLTRLGSTQEQDDYYFSDASGLVRSSIDAQLTETGPNGSALMVNSPLVNHSGIGGELSGCEWPDELGISLPGAVVIQEFPLLAQSTSNPCPFELFADGFESGDTSVWSSSVP